MTAIDDLQPIPVVRPPAAPFFYLLVAIALTRTRPAHWIMLALTPLLIAGPLTYYPNVIRAKETDISPREIVGTIVGQWRPGDVIYHGNVGSIMPMWQYTPPDLPVYLMPVQGTSAGMLRPLTRQAMGMDERWLNAVDWRRAWLVWTAGPTIDPAEDVAVLAMLERYPHQTIRTFSDDFSTFGLWLLYNPAYSVGVGR